MKRREYVQVDPAELRLPASRRDGADPVRLQRQIARYGKSIVGLPIPEVRRAADGELVVYDGVTRATRTAKLLPGVALLVEVTGRLSELGGNLPKIKERL